jgi:hypothetical protein
MIISSFHPSLGSNSDYAVYYFPIEGVAPGNGEMEVVSGLSSMDLKHECEFLSALSPPPNGTTPLTLRGGAYKNMLRSFVAKRVDLRDLPLNRYSGKHYTGGLYAVSFVRLFVRLFCMGLLK